MSENGSEKSGTSLKTRSVTAMSQASLRSCVSEARRKVELSNLKTKQAQRAAVAKIEAARMQAEAARMQAEAEVQAAVDAAEQDALELALLEEDARSMDGHRSVSRARNQDTPDRKCSALDLRP